MLQRKDWILYLKFIIIIRFGLSILLIIGTLTVNDFAYHTSLGWRIFVFAGVLSLIIACLTVSFQAIKVALAIPLSRCGTSET